MDNPNKLTVAEEIGQQTPPPLALITTPPDDPQVRDDIGKSLFTGIVRKFVGNLPDDDRRLWDNPPRDVSSSPDHMRLLNSFDEFLLRQFAEFGVLMFMSVGVLQRMFEWKKGNPEFFDRMGRELALHARVFRGEKSAPFPDDLDKFADSAIAELARLLSRQRDEFGSRRGAPTCARVAGWMKVEIESNVQDFTTLAVELPQLVGYVESLPRTNPQAAQTLLRGDMTPAALFYLWYAACSNRSVKDVQNRISGLRSGR